MLKAGKGKPVQGFLSRLLNFTHHLFSWRNSMNIEQAKTIPISVILDKLNRKPQRKKCHKAVFFSVFREERTASLWIDNKTNTWRDFGDTKWEGGDGIRLVQGYLDSQEVNCDVSSALRWLRNM